MPKSSDKLVLGLTGGIGSGKSVIGLIFSDLGIPVFDSDLAGKRLLTENKNIVKNITSAFGGGILNEQGLPDRAKLAAQVFNNRTELQKLNAIIHPAVSADFDAWVEKQTTQCVIRESALLFETGFYKNSHKNILITAPEELRIQRVMKRNGITREQVISRIKNQWTDEEKSKLADFIIANDEQQPLLPQVWVVIEELGILR